MSLGDNNLVEPTTIRSVLTLLNDDFKLSGILLRFRFQGTGLYDIGGSPRQMSACQMEHRSQGNIFGMQLYEGSAGGQVRHIGLRLPLLPLHLQQTVKAIMKCR